MTRVSLLILVALTGLSACSFMEGKKIDYKSAGTLPTLEAPPDLIVPAGDSRYTVPGASAKGSASYSSYDRERAAQPSADANRLLPKVENARIERAGTQRWLVVAAQPGDVWPVVRDFWQELGFIINVETPEAGVMETDWAENRARIPQDAVRNFLGKVIDGLYSTAERDRFRTRLEPAADGQGTEIYISHRGMLEVFEGTQGGGDQGQGRTVWQPRPADPELEAEMLRRLMVRFGVEEAKAQSMVAEKAQPPRASLIKAGDGAQVLALPEGFDRAWRRVGLALDRIGFSVEDRDRAAGVYFVRYADPDAQTKQEKSGFFSKLAFWRSSEPAIASQEYRILVAAQQEVTRVSVLDQAGKPAEAGIAGRILGLLHEQLK